MLQKMKRMRSVVFVVVFTLFVVTVTPQGVAFGAVAEEIKKEIIVGEVSNLISDAVSTESVVTDFEENEESALLFDGNELIVDVSTNPEEDITLSDGLGDDISIGLPENLTKNTEVLTGNDGTVLYNSEEKNPAAELAVQAIDEDEVFEGLRLTMIINDASADHEYDFTLDLPEGSKIVTSAEYFGEDLDTGELLIVDANNEISQIIEAPWAKDANGNNVDTRYIVEQNTIKQVVDFNKDTAFPIVADPNVTILEDLKCLGAIASAMIGGALAVKAIKAVVKLVKSAGSITKAAKAIYAVAKEKAKGKKLPAIKAVLTGVLAPSLIDLVWEVTGISAINRHCVLVAY